MAKIESILSYLAVASHQRVTMFQMSILTQSDPEVNKIKLRSTQQLWQGYQTPFEFGKSFE